MKRLLLVGLVVAGWTVAAVAQNNPGATPVPPVGVGAGVQGTVTGQPGAAGVQGGVQGTVTGQPGTAGVQGGVQGTVTGQPGTAGVGGTVTGQVGVPGVGGTVTGGLSGQGTTTGTGLIPVPGQPGMYYQQNTYGGVYGGAHPGTWVGPYTYGGYSPYGSTTGYHPGTMTGYTGGVMQGGYSYAPSVVGGGMMQAGYTGATGGVMPAGYSSGYPISGVVTGDCGLGHGYGSNWSYGTPVYGGYDSGWSDGGRRGWRRR